MAVKETGKEEIRQQQGIGSSTSSHSNNQQDRDGFNIFSLLRQYETRALSPEGEAFVSKLKQILNESANGQLRLDHIANVSFVKDQQDNLILLLFGELMSKKSKEILSYKDFNDAVTLIKEKMPNAKIMNIIVIPRQTYQYVSTYADIIIRSFFAVKDASLSNLTIDAFAKQTIIIDNNQQNVKNVIERLGLPPTAIQYGILVYLQVKPGENHLLGAIGLKNRFIAQPNIPIGYGSIHQQPGLKKIVPIIEITELIPLIPSTKLYPLLLTITDYVVMRQGMWKSFAKDVQKYIIDPETKKPLEGLDRTELEQLYALCFTNPVFAVSVVEGKLAVPYTTEFFNPRAFDSVSEFDKFFQVVFQDKAQPLFGTQFMEIVGIVEHNGRLIDSRMVDYLWIIDNLGYRQEFEKFQIKFNPEIEFEELSKLIPIDPLFVNNVVIISPKIQSYTDTLLQKVKIISTAMETANFIDLSNIINQYGYTPPMGYMPTGGFFRY